MGLFDNLGDQTLLGTPSRQVSNVGPLTTEGQILWNEYMKMVNAIPSTRNIKFGGQNWVTPNRQKERVLGLLSSLDASRRGTLGMQPEQAGILGKLAPLLAMMGGTNKTGNQDGYFQKLLSLLGGNDTYGDISESGFPSAAGDAMMNSTDYMDDIDTSWVSDLGEGWM